MSVPVRAATSGPKRHFFGYYEKSPWDRSGRYLLALEVAIDDRMPEAEETAGLGVVDLADGNRFRALAETRAWNWQQGCMLQWLPPGADRRVLYNDRQGDRFVSVVLDVQTGERRTLPLPVHAVSHDGRFAMTSSFSRLWDCRRVCGYAGVADPWADDPHPEADGIHFLDVETGESRLIVSLAQLAAFQPVGSMGGAKHFINHLLLNPDGTRFLVLHRWLPAGDGHFVTRMLTADPDGSELYCVVDDGQVSHFDWKNPRQILATARQHGISDRYFLFTDRAPEAEVVGKGVLTHDGHCSFSPDGRWILTDSYPGGQPERTVLLYRLADGRRFDIGHFYSPPELTGDVRCDLHPRWSRDGRQVCIDSAHEGARQIYVLDVKEVV